MAAGIIQILEKIAPVVPEICSRTEGRCHHNIPFPYRGCSKISGKAAFNFTLMLKEIYNSETYQHNSVGIS